MDTDINFHLTGSISLIHKAVLDSRCVVALTTADTTGWWFSISISWFSLAHSNRVYIMALPRFTSTCSCSLEMINCLVSDELKFNKDQMPETEEWTERERLFLLKFTHFALCLKALVPTEMVWAFSREKSVQQKRIEANLVCLTYILLLKKASKDKWGAVSGYVSGNEISSRNDLDSFRSPICRKSGTVMLYSKQCYWLYR